MPNDSPTLKKFGNEVFYRTEEQLKADSRFYEMAVDLIPKLGMGWNRHNLVTLKGPSIARILYYYDLYKRIVEVPGVICEFGVQYGGTLALLTNFRGLLEPSNYARKIYGFDTFAGFSGVHEKDGGYAAQGDYAVPSKYEDILEEILSYHEKLNPIPSIKKFNLIKGDAIETFPRWLEEHPGAIVSMAIFDMDIYKPTKIVLEKIIPRLTKGSILVFDELNCLDFPGEARAVDEVLGLNKITLRRSPHQPHCSWAVWGE